MATGTSTSAGLPAQSRVQVEDGRGWANYPGVPVDITPTSNGSPDITPTANRSAQGR